MMADVTAGCICVNLNFFFFNRIGSIYVNGSHFKINDLLQRLHTCLMFFFLNR